MPTRSTPKKTAAKGSRRSTPRHWLLKSEPDVYPYSQLESDGRTYWDGVRNYQARNMLRDDMQVGDLVLFYHSNAKPPGVAGVARVVREGYPDPTQFDPKDSHFDAKSDPDDPRWYVIDVEPVRAFESEVPIADLKSNPKLEDMAVVQRGQRLSVQAVTPLEFREVLRMAGLKVSDL